MVKISDVVRRKGEQAGELLQNDAFVYAVNELEREYYDQFLRTGLSDKELRERLYMSVHVLKDIKNKLDKLHDKSRAAKLEEEREERARKSKIKAK